MRQGAVRAPCGFVPRNSPWEHLVVQPCLVARVPSPQANPGDGRTYGAQTARDEAQVPEEDIVPRGSHVARAARRRDRRRRVRDPVRPAGGYRRANGHERRAARAGAAAAGPASPRPARGAAAGLSDRERPDAAAHVYAEARLAAAVRPEGLFRDRRRRRPRQRGRAFGKRGLLGGAGGGAPRAEPSSIEIATSPNPGFDGPAREWILKALFRPARVHGRAVRVHITQPLDYSVTSG